MKINYQIVRDHGTHRKGKMRFRMTIIVQKSNWVLINIVTGRVSDGIMNRWEHELVKAD